MSVQFKAAPWRDYELIDSGGREKLERFGKYVLRRPEISAVWRKELDEMKWKQMADATFKEGRGQKGNWVQHRKIDDVWGLEYPLGNKKISLNLSLTAFRYLVLPFRRWPRQSQFRLPAHRG